MTFESFKNICLSKKRGDFILPNDDNVIKLGIIEAIEDIANTTNIIPLALVTKDNRNDVLRPLDKDEFIRKPKSIDDNKQLIDIDESLCYAVVYAYLETLTQDIKKLQFFKYKKEQILINYNWNNFKAIQSLEAKNEF